MELSAEQLDVLAILFTCIKVLYVGGAIQRTLQLIQVCHLLLLLTPHATGLCASHGPRQLAEFVCLDVIVCSCHQISQPYADLQLH